MNDVKPFEKFMFSGGAGMFIQYHDIVKPAYLYAICKMLLTNETYGLPFQIIKNLSPTGMIEWYTKRRYINPLKCLDFDNKASNDQLDDIMHHILISDDSIYDLAPALNIKRLLSVYHKQHMSFPIYVYSEKEEPYIKMDCKNLFNGIPIKYVFGDLKECIHECDQNFTYIFSDIELVRKAAEILSGLCSHVLLPMEYRYNYIDNCRTFKYDLMDLSKKYPFNRIGTTLAIDYDNLIRSFLFKNINT